MPKRSAYDHQRTTTAWLRQAWATSTALIMIVLVGVLLRPAVAGASEIKANCAASTSTHVECMSLSITGVASGLPGTGEKGGLSPEDLRAAYNLTKTGGAGQTVTIVDAYNDPDAEANLATYREKYKLSPCTEGNGCFEKVNQKGEKGNYPSGEPGWSVEISLDLDMVSAACPECHIHLVEASNSSFTNMDEAENEAAALAGTTEISDSWGAVESSSRTAEDSYFDHAGIPITVSAGDYCYNNECRGSKAPNWPSTSPYVISVGGTRLEKVSGGRGWKDSVWYEPESEYGAIGTGSGCAIYEPKPTWQTDNGCSNRSDTDISAVAACSSPLSIYDSYGEEGWFNECGTSAAAPIIAGVEALSTATAKEEGAEAFWKQLGPQGKLFDTTEGHNWYSSSCGSYLCNAAAGYDGPTGWGTPDGRFNVGWTFEATPLEAGATESTMVGVTCPAASDCMAIANYTTSTRPHATYAEQWNGTTWEIKGFPSPSGAKEAWMEGVSCSSATACTAVGYYKNSAGVTGAFAERWNGSEWSLQNVAVPSGAKESAFSGVSCASGSSCMAVGQYVNSAGVKVSLAEQWNGAEWNVESTPNPSGAKETVMHSVSCTSATSCIAAADDVTSSGVLSAFIEKWDGTEWVTQGVATPYGAQWAVLEGVSCASQAACTAVGYYKNLSNTIVTLAERWNGSEWNVQSTPLESGATESALRSVSCASATACTAVATYADAIRSIATYSLRWNGSEWSIQGFPSPEGATGAWTHSVSCSAATTCTAVGGYKNAAGTTVTLAEGESS